MTANSSGSAGFRQAAVCLAGLPVLLAFMLLPGCCHSPGPKADPAVALKSYLESTSQRKIADAREMLTKRARKQADAELFKTFLDSGGQALARRLRALAASGDLALVMRATLSDAQGNQIEMVREGGRWSVDAGPVVPSPGSSPQGALEQFVKAAESGDCQTLMGCAPPRIFERHTRAQILSGCRTQQARLKQIGAAIRKSAARPRQISDDKAEMEFGKGRKITLVKVAERWYIEDL